jgi:hypothetical protein
MDAMAEVAPVGADGFNQDFGFNSLDGDHGSKQGWTDLDTSQAINIHSVGWTDRYFGAILETSDSPQYNTMRADSTITADLIQGAQSAGQIAAARAAAAATAAQAAAVVAAARSALTSTGSQVQRVIQHVLRAAGLIG